MTADGPQRLTGYQLRDYDDLIARLDAARRSRDMPIYRLAEAIGCNKATLAANLRGKHRMDARNVLAAYGALAIDLALIPRGVGVPPHGWREFNEHGNTCHWPGCTRNEDEHHEEQP